MKIIRQHAFGGPEVLQLEDLELPEPAAGEVLLRTHAAAITFFDILNRRGDLAKRDYYKDEVLPLSPGYQGSGYVEALGPDVTGVQVGDRVAWALAAGSYASHVIAPAAQLIPVPDDIDLDEAAGLPVQALLAYKLTHEAYPLAEGDWALVQSAAGGVGTLVTQFARMRGARVIGVVSAQEKAVVAKEAGAEAVIVSGTTADVAAEVKRITGGDGVRVVYDAVGKDTFEANLNSLAPRGYLINFGQASGFVPPLDLMTLNDKGSLFVTRFCLPHFFDESWPPLNFLDRAFQWMREGKLTVRIDSRYPLAQADEAHAAVEERRTSGRVLLIP